jgi:hypothetical protein
LLDPFVDQRLVDLVVEVHTRDFRVGCYSLKD